MENNLLFILADIVQEIKFFTQIYLFLTQVCKDYMTTSYCIFYCLFVCLDTKHVLKVKPFGIGPCPRRRVGLSLLGSELVVCGGVG